MLPYLAQPSTTIVTTFVPIVDEVAHMTDSLLNGIGIGGVRPEVPRVRRRDGRPGATRNLRVDQCFLACLVDVKRGAFHRESPQGRAR